MKEQQQQQQTTLAEARDLAKARDAVLTVLEADYDLRVVLLNLIQDERDYSLEDADDETRAACAACAAWTALNDALNALHDACEVSQ